MTYLIILNRIQKARQKFTEDKQDRGQQNETKDKHSTKHYNEE